MKNLFLSLAFMLVGSFAFANNLKADVEYTIVTVEIPMVNENVKTAQYLDTYTCIVEDGHNQGTGTGSTMAQACRRAKRALKSIQKEIQEL